MAHFLAHAIAAIALALPGGFAVAPASAQETPANCTRPTAAERAVCATPELAALDAQLLGHLAVITEYGPAWAIAEVWHDQAAWLVARDACGADRPCLEAEYRIRLAAIYAKLECLRTDLPLDG